MYVRKIGTNIIQKCWYNTNNFFLCRLYIYHKRSGNTTLQTSQSDQNILLHCYQDSIKITLRGTAVSLLIFVSAWFCFPLGLTFSATFIRYTSEELKMLPLNTVTQQSLIQRKGKSTTENEREVTCCGLSSCYVCSVDNM